MVNQQTRGIESEHSGNDIRGLTEAPDGIKPREVVNQQTKARGPAEAPQVSEPRRVVNQQTKGIGIVR